MGELTELSPLTEISGGSMEPWSSGIGGGRAAPSRATTADRTWLIVLRSEKVGYRMFYSNLEIRGKSSASTVCAASQFAGSHNIFLMLEARPDVPGLPPLSISC